MKHWTSLSEFILFFYWSISNNFTQPFISCSVKSYKLKLENNYWWHHVDDYFIDRRATKVYTVKGSCSSNFQLYKTSVIKQKGESQNECFKKTKHTKFPEKRTFLTPWYAHVRFSENLVCFVFLEHPFWVSPFCLITDENRKCQ